MPKSPPIDFEQLATDQDDVVLEVDSSTEHRLATLAMLRHSRRTVLITSRDLDSPIYDDSEICTAIRDLIVNSSRAKVHILLQNSGALFQREHRLVLLAQQLSSFIDIRLPRAENANYNHACLLADQRGVIYRPQADRYEGTVCFNAPGQAADLAHNFDFIWETAEPHPGLRRLHI